MNYLRYVVTFVCWYCAGVLESVSTPPSSWPRVLHVFGGLILAVIGMLAYFQMRDRG